jgi:hypothetical protein
MIYCFEVAFPDGGPRRQFTSCCGATDKGVDGGCGCRSCYNLIDDYIGFQATDVAMMRKAITDPDVQSRFEEFLAEPKFDCFNDWHRWKLQQVGGGL